MAHEHLCPTSRHEKLLPNLENSHSTTDSHYICTDTSTLSLLSCPCAQQLYRIGSLHVTGQSVTATVLRDTIKRKHYLPKIDFRKSACTKFWNTKITVINSTESCCSVYRHKPTSHIIALLFLTTKITPIQLSESKLTGFHSFRVENLSGTSKWVQCTVSKFHANKQKYLLTDR